MVAGRAGREINQRSMYGRCERRGQVLSAGAALVLAGLLCCAKSLAARMVRLATCSNISPIDCAHSIPGKASIQGYDNETSDNNRLLEIRRNRRWQAASRAVRTRGGTTLE